MRRPKSSLVAAILAMVGGSIFIAPSASVAAAPTIYFVGDAPEENQRWITTWSSTTGESKARKLLGRFIPRDLVGRSFLVEGSKSEVVDLISSTSLPAGTKVRVEVDIQMRSQSVPNDTYFSYQWDLADSSTSQYGIGLPAARALFNGGVGLPPNVAVLDTGITTHVDLTGNARWSGSNGWDFYDGDSNPSDPGDYCTSSSGTTDSSWHGTHVAGTIAADTDNNTGIAGIAPASKIVSGRVLGNCGGSLTDVADGIRWAAGLPVPLGSATPTPLTNPARVINLSLGGDGACIPYLQSAITAARAAGALVVVAAGNENVDAANVTPANCAGVMTVAATGQSGKRAGYSNYGANVDIAAQGGDFSVTSPFAQGGILSTVNSGQYTVSAGNVFAFYQGTSMATPHVAAVAALLLTVKPNLTVADLEELLNTSAMSFPADGTANSCSIPGKCGAGILSAVGALQLLASRSQTSISAMLARSAAVADFTFNLNSGATVAAKGQSALLSASFSQPGRVTYFADGKRIAKCANLQVANTSSSCSWKPTVQKTVLLTVEFIPSDNSFAPQVRTLNVGIVRRTGTR